VGSEQRCVRRYRDDDAGAWDALVTASVNGTLLHTRRYLGYHGDRFEDASVVIEGSGGRVVAVLPAAWDADGCTVVSHPGITYGGLVHDGSLGGEAVLAAVENSARCWAAQGATALVYRPVPWIYHRRPAADDVYALSRLGATRDRCALSCAVDVQAPARLSHGRRQSLRVAGRTVGLAGGAEHIDALWQVLEENLAERHGAQATHSAAEMRLLASLFPGEVLVTVATVDGDVVAGAVVYRTPRVDHAQYLASSERGRACGALDAVVARCIERAGEDGRAVFDFGISTLDGGRVLNSGLHRYKTSFGGGGVVYESYRVDLA
jgi:Acetyltransferase (GNAT) domain